MEQNSAKVFSENWSIYQKIILHNYMHHAAFVKKTAEVFRKLSQKKLRILDIGCGDAMALLPILQQAPVTFYTGYDLSPYALQMAAANLSSQHFPSSFKEGNMMMLIQEEKKQFDVVHSSFAIHHLQDDEKQKLFKACFDKLAPGGKMIYIDVFRQRGNTREQYIEDYIFYIKNDWPLLTPNEKQPIYEHVSQFDFPSGFEETITWFKQEGFSLVESYKPDHRHAMIVLERE